jgi:hypothetical protein
MGHADSISMNGGLGKGNESSTQRQVGIRVGEGAEARKEKRRGKRNVAGIFQSIGDEKSLLLFRSIAAGEGKIDTERLLLKLNVTRKQYYSRLSRLKKVGLVASFGGMYGLTSFGKIIYKAVYFSDIANEYKWKLNALDMIKATEKELPNNEFDSIVDTMINNSEIKNLLR